MVARGITDGAVANPVRLRGRLLDDLGAGLQPVEDGVESAVARRMDVPGWSAGPTVIQRIAPWPTSLRTSKPRLSRQKASEASGSSCGRKVV
jgi:hypothetical protein